MHGPVSRTCTVENSFGSVDVVGAMALTTIFGSSLVKKNDPVILRRHAALQNAKNGVMLESVHHPVINPITVQLEVTAVGKSFYYTSYQNSKKKIIGNPKAGVPTVTRLMLSLKLADPESGEYNGMWGTVWNPEDFEIITGHSFESCLEAETSEGTVTGSDLVGSSIGKNIIATITTYLDTYNSDGAAEPKYKFKIQ